MLSHTFRSALRTASPLRTFASVTDGLGLNLPARYGHYINGTFVEPLGGDYFDNVSPIDGKTFIQAARGTKADIDAAVDSADAAFKATWKNVSVTERSNMLLRIADTIEQNADRLAKIETVDNGKAVRESMAADLPLVVDHFRYFAGVIRAEEGSVSAAAVVCVVLCAACGTASFAADRAASHTLLRRSPGYGDRRKLALTLHPGAARRGWLDHSVEFSA